MITLYDDVMRTIVEIPEDQLASLSEICRRLGISRAEGIRRAVRIYLDLQSSKATQDAFGVWKDRKKEGLAYEDEIRSEWAPRSDH